MFPISLVEFPLPPPLTPICHLSSPELLTQQSSFHLHCILEYCEDSQGRVRVEMVENKKKLFKPSIEHGTFFC